MFRDADRIFGAEVSKLVNVSVTLRRFANYFRPYVPQYFIVVVMMIVSTWTQATAPRLIGQAVDCFLVPLADIGVADESFGPTSVLGSDGADAGASQLGGLQSNCTYIAPKPNWTEAEMIAGLGGLVLRIVGLTLLGLSA